MNGLVRWGKFCLVGAMGAGVQLASLALFTRWMAGHYLCASAAAVEVALLHNFFWHSRYTWRDRGDGCDPRHPRRQFIRFQVSNGFVSIAGNLGLMWLLVHKARLPLLISNLIAILCCSVVNFRIQDSWAFAGGRESFPGKQ